MGLYLLSPMRLHGMVLRNRDNVTFHMKANMLRKIYGPKRTMEETREFSGVRGCIQKFPDWPPGARTANGTALCH
jgi:hypothetical protein